MAEHDDTLEHLFRQMETDGWDTSKLRAIRTDIDEAPVGDDTPAPGSLMLAEPALVLPPAVHQGLNDTPEGPFYLPPFGRERGTPRAVRRLSKRLTRTQVSLAALAMYSLSATVVVAVKW